MILMLKPLSLIEAHIEFLLLIMNLCTFFKIIVNIHFTTYDSLHFRTLQDHFDHSLTHLTPFFAIWRGGKVYKNIASRAITRTFLICVKCVFNVQYQCMNIQIMIEWILNNFHYYFMKFLVYVVVLQWW
jgi:hypothetical protein